MSQVAPLALALITGAALFSFMSAGNTAENIVKAPAAAITEHMAGHRETAVFAGGCF